jgi:hypothetical protein
MPTPLVYQTGESLSLGLKKNPDKYHTKSPKFFSKAMVSKRCLQAGESNLSSSRPIRAAGSRKRKPTPK